jgi:hypothetical protein
MWCDRQDCRNADCVGCASQSLFYEAFGSQCCRQVMQSWIFALELAGVLFGQAGLIRTRKRLAKISQQPGDLLVHAKIPLLHECLTFAQGSGLSALKSSVAGMEFVQQY